MASRWTLLYHLINTIPMSSVRVISTFGRCDICHRHSPLSRQNRWQLPLSVLYDRLLQQPPVRHYRAEPQPSPEGTERVGSHRASRFLPDERHGSAPTAALGTDQTTDDVQASDPYFQGEVLSDPVYLHEQLRDHQVAKALRSTTAPLFYRPFVSTVFASPAFCTTRHLKFGTVSGHPQGRRTFSVVLGVA